MSETIQRDCAPLPRLERRPARFRERLRALGTPRETLTLDLRIDTPAFTFGRHPRGRGGQAKGDAEARLSTIRGLLAFWWRAAAWGPAWRAEHETGENAARRKAALARVHAWEQAIFGAAGGEDSGGQGAIEWGMDEPKPEILAEPWPQKDVRHGRAYMGNQGLKDHRPLRAGATLRLHVSRIPIWGRDPAENRAATKLQSLGLDDPWSPLTLTSRPWTGAVSPPTVTDALVLLHLFGSIGSRSRRGFGSVVVASATAARSDTSFALEFPQTITEVRDAIAETLAGYADIPLAPYTALSAGARVLFSAFPKQDANAAHEALAYAMLRFRGYGRYDPKSKLRKVGDVEIGPNTQAQHSAVAREDHDTWYVPIKEAVFGTLPKSPANPSATPRRAGFGLPMNTFSVKSGGAVSQQEKDLAIRKAGVSARFAPNVSKEMRINLPGTGGVSRRASPLLLKARDCGDGAIGQWVLLPADAFLPASAPSLTADITVNYKILWTEGKKKKTKLVRGSTHRIVMPGPDMNEAFKLAGAFFKFIRSHYKEIEPGLEDGRSSAMQVALLSPKCGQTGR